MRTEANKLMKEASEIVEGPDLATFVVRFCPIFFPLDTRTTEDRDPVGLRSEIKVFMSKLSPEFTPMIHS